MIWIFTEVRPLWKAFVVATYSNSPALSMIFRQEDGRFVFYADENLDVCLAVT